jgi:two-component system, chemotaxis family, sensor kinase CheA
MTNNDDNTGKAEKDFLAEAEEIIDRLSLDLVGLSDSSVSGECDPEHLNSIFRGAHSLKGLAGMFGLTRLAELAHNLENLLDSLRLGKINLTQSIVNVLFDSLDLLGTLVRDAGAGSNAEHDVTPAIERINSCISVDNSTLKCGITPGEIRPPAKDIERTDRVRRTQAP